ncbi:MAG: hypothetical protein HRU22_17475 [Gammaproteobacteria bacterium]|nr:hypothetical protein [Gammaproteobacteria bacterium]
MKINLKYLAVLSLPLMVACTGHPAAGKWQLNSASEYQYSRLVVNFDGKAELYKKDQAIAWLHCFWTASAADAIGLECASADADAANEKFFFKVSGENSGQLMIDDTVVAQFDNEDPTTK